MGYDYEVLINEVRKYPWLYMTKSIDYRDSIKRENSWAKVALATGLTVSQAHPEITLTVDDVTNTVNFEIGDCLTESQLPQFSCPKVKRSMCKIRETEKNQCE